MNFTPLPNRQTKLYLVYQWTSGWTYPPAALQGGRFWRWTSIVLISWSQTSHIDGAAQLDEKRKCRLLKSIIIFTPSDFGTAKDWTVRTCTSTLCSLHFVTTKLKNISLWIISNVLIWVAIILRDVGYYCVEVYLKLISQHNCMTNSWQKISYLPI